MIAEVDPKQKRWTLQTALQHANEQIAASEAMRSVDDTAWMMAMIYDNGNQWGYVESNDLSRRVKYIRNVVDPYRVDVRATMNKIHEEVIYYLSATNPREFGAYFPEVEGDVVNGIIAGLGDRILGNYLPEIGALETYWEMNLARMTFGTAGIRLTLEPTSEREVAPGKPLRNYRIGWAPVYPWEFIRDPGSMSMRIEQNEDSLGYHAVRSTAWVKRHYGKDIETEATVGGLMQYQKYIANTDALSRSSVVTDSKQKGVIVHEWYFKGYDGQWDQMLVAYEDIATGRGDLKPLHFGPSPFACFPFFFFHFDRLSQHRWSRGIPHILMAGQDIVNIAVTWMLRTMQAGTGRLIAEKGVLDLGPGGILHNRIDKPIIWDRSESDYPQLARAPEFSQPPQVNPAVTGLLNLMPEYMRKAINLTEVHRGQSSKRGESGVAIEAKLRSADVPLEHIRTSDEVTLGRLLHATFLTLADPRWMRSGQAIRLAGANTPRDHIDLLLRTDVKNAVNRVKILPSTLRPTTPGEAQEFFTGMVERQMMDPEDAKWEMMRQGKVHVSTRMARAYRNQMAEIPRLIGGAEVVPNIAEDHRYHMRTIREFLDNPDSRNLTDEARAHITNHYAAHIKALKLSAMIEQYQMEAPVPARGSPPAGPMPGQPAPQGAPEAGPTLPAINVT